MTIELKNKYKSNSYLYLICFLIAFGFLLICSSNSFLYAFNDWVDVNWYITMSKGITNGKVPYKDLFEQKGPILYLLLSPFCLFPNPYYGVFILEVICFSLFLFFCYKLARLYLSKECSFLMLFIVAFLILTSKCFAQGGGAVEEYCLPMVAYILYMFLRYIKNNENFSKLNSIIIGVLLSCIFWMKYVVLIIPATILMGWLILNFINKNYRDTINKILYMLIGFLIPTAVVFIYFIINNGVYDMLYCYFYLNLTAYGNFEISLIKTIIKDFRFVLALFSILLFYRNKKQLFAYISILLIDLILIFATAKHIYYKLIFLVFLPLGLIAIFNLLSLVFKKISLKKTTKILAVTIICCSFYGLSFIYSNSFCEVKYKKDYYAPNYIAKVINESGEDKSFYVYNLMDYGYYNALKISPNEKYYAKNNFEKDQNKELFDAQKQAVKSGKYNFILTDLNTYIEEYDFLAQDYTEYTRYSYQYHENRNETWTNTVVLLIKK